MSTLAYITDPRPMRQWVLSFPYPLRILFASRPAIMGQVLRIVYRVIATHLIKKAGHIQTMACTGAVTLIQRFGSALNLNIHFHILFLDGVYVDRPDGTARFLWVKAPTRAELTQLAHTIASRVGRFLEPQGLPERDAEFSLTTGQAAAVMLYPYRANLMTRPMALDPRSKYPSRQRYALKVRRDACSATQYIIDARRLRSGALSRSRGRRRP